MSSVKPTPIPNTLTETQISFRRLSELSDRSLLDNTERLAKEEREALTLILHHLREIDRRKLFSALGLPSLFEYAKSRLHYSEDQAYRRINAMRLLRDLPELEAKINSGAINLSQLSSAQSFFRKEKSHSKNDFSKLEKLKLLSKLENKSTRESEKVLLTEASTPQNLMSDQTRVLSSGLLEFKFAGDVLLEEKMLRLRGLLAHKHPYLTMNQLLHFLCDFGLGKLDPCLQKGRKHRGRNGVIKNAAISMRRLQYGELN